MRVPIKFRTRLFLYYFAAMGLLTMILAVYFIRFEENRVREAFHEQLVIQARLVDTNIVEFGQLTDSEALSGLTRRMAEVAKIRITIVNPDGQVLADTNSDYRTMENHSDRQEIRKALAGRESLLIRYSETMGENLIYVACPIKIDGRIAGVVRVARDQRDLDHLIIRLRTLIIGGIAIIAILPIFLGIVAMNRIAQPILELKRAASAISHGDLSVKVTYFGRDELADLGLAFNSMARRLSDSFTRLRNETHKLQVILENLADGILVIDRHLQILLVNPAARDMLGLGGKSVEGRPILEAVLNHHLAELIQEVNRSQEAFESELTIYYPNNRQLQVLLAPLQDETGLLMGSIVVLHDLTQIRRLERVRQDFVANVSHELRTPLTTIKAMTETLLAGAWRDEAVLLRYLKAIDEESDRLTFLLKDLLDLAKLDARVEMEKGPVDLAGLMEQMRELFKPVPGKTPAFELTPPAADLPHVWANRDQLKQVLFNLLDNAFKYTSPQGRVRLEAWREGDRVKVIVADTGIGIPTEDQQRIFERFYRVDKARSREVGGTGLGLAIVKHIIEAHDGQIEVESALHQGTVFSFTLPCA